MNKAEELMEKVKGAGKCKRLVSFRCPENILKLVESKTKKYDISTTDVILSILKAYFEKEL